MKIKINVDKTFDDGNDMAHCTIEATSIVFDGGIQGVQIRDKAYFWSDGVIHGNPTVISTLTSFTRWWKADKHGQTSHNIRDCGNSKNRKDDCSIEQILSSWIQKSSTMTWTFDMSLHLIPL